MLSFIMVKIKKRLPKAKGKLLITSGMKQIDNFTLQISIDITAMTDILDDNLLFLCFDLIDNAIITNPNSIKQLSSSKF